MESRYDRPMIDFAYRERAITRKTYRGWAFGFDLIIRAWDERHGGGRMSSTGKAYREEVFAWCVDQFGRGAVYFGDSGHIGPNDPVHVTAVKLRWC